MKKSFQRDSGCYTCQVCGKKTRAVEGDEASVGLCLPCYIEAGHENGHMDGRHEGQFVKQCPLCNPQINMMEILHSLGRKLEFDPNHPVIMVPTRQQVENLEVGDVVLNPFGHWSIITSIHCTGEDVNGKAFALYYSKQLSNGFESSMSYKEDTLLRTVHLTCRYNNMELDDIEWKLTHPEITHSE